MLIQIKGIAILINRLQDFGIVNQSEIVIAERKPKSIFGIVLNQELDKFKDKNKPKVTQESVKLFGKEIKIDPESLRVNKQLLAYVTNAKEPVREVRDRSNVSLLIIVANV